MSLWDTLETVVATESEHYVYARLPADHIHPAPPGSADLDYDTALETEKHYLRVWLSEMCLAHDRKWCSTWHPVAHSSVRLQFGGYLGRPTTVDIPHVAGPLHLDGVGTANLDEVVQLNHPLTALLPFRGGDVEVTAGLLAMKGRDHLETTLGILGELSGLLAVPQLSAALVVIGPLASGLEKLVGATDGRMHLGLHDTWVGRGGTAPNILKPGYLVVARTTADRLPPAELWVRDGRLCRGASLDHAGPLTGVTYMLLRIEGRAERDDWSALTTLASLRDMALEHLLRGDEGAASTALTAARMAALRAPELTRIDALRVATQLVREHEEVAAELGRRSARSPMERTFAELMAEAPSVEEVWAEVDLDSPLAIA